MIRKEACIFFDILRCPGNHVPAVVITLFYFQFAFPEFLTMTGVAEKFVNNVRELSISAG